MDKDVSIYLKQILDAIILIEEYTMGISEQDFLNDFKLQDAVSMRLHLIGEIANKLPNSFTEEIPEISWVQIVGMRNIIAHQYLEITKSTVWSTIVSDLPELKQVLLRKLQI